jgi:hypothetical protein
VSYTKRRTGLLLTREQCDKRTIFSATNLNKDEAWKYVEEWRVITKNKSDPAKPEEWMSFPPVALTGVAFGCRMAEDLKSRVRTMYKTMPHIKFYQAQMTARSFGLDFVTC